MRHLVFVVVSTALLAACGGMQQGQKQDRTESSVASPLYAASYPTRLSDATKRWDSGLENTNKAIEEMPQYPSDLSDPDWVVVKRITTEADDAGNDAAVVEKLRETRLIAAFVENRGPEISRKVGRDVDEAAGRSGESGRFESKDAVRAGLRSASTEILEQEARMYNPAHYTIEAYDDDLGRKNRKALQKQADQVTAASYFVRVEGPELVDEMRTVEAQSKDVRATLDRELEEHQKRIDAPGTPAGEKKALTERKAKLEAARAELDGVDTEAKRRLETAEKTLKDVQERYDKTLRGLLDDLDSRAEPAPK